MAEKLRQTYIDSILSNKFEDNDPKYNNKNKAFYDIFESLTLDELKNLSDELILEEKL